MHRLSLTHPVFALSGPVRVRWWAGCVLAGGLLAPAFGTENAPWPDSLPRFSALGLTINGGAVHPGVHEQRISPKVAWVVQWGRLRLSNGGPLASRTGDASERGLAADLASRGTLRLSATIGREQGRRSDGVAALRGVHDIAPGWRGTLRAGWRLAPQWEAAAAWTTERLPRSGGERLSVTLARDWPLYGTLGPWGVTVGGSATWRDAVSAVRVYGITAEDTVRSGYPETTVGSGWTEIGAFATARRPLDTHWVLYGGLNATRLVGAAAEAPWVQREGTMNLRVGLGRRF